jgi:hypothetical protein
MLHAHEPCAVEVKLLLSPGETKAAISSLKLRKGTTGQVFFFDTEKLALLSQGVIVRVRQGSDNDLTIKVRPLDDRKFVDLSQNHKGFKCEMDLTGGKASRAYSIAAKYAASHVPETGTDILKRLSVSQRILLNEARVSVDWNRVRRIASIESTDWETKGQPPFRVLTLELWQYSGGTVLELSTKVGRDDGPSTYEELKRLLSAKDLMQSVRQRSKTNIVLEALAHRTTQ